MGTNHLRFGYESSQLWVRIDWVRNVRGYETSGKQLNDQKFYQKVIDDPTDEINKRECLYLNRLIADDVISKETYNYLLPQNPNS